MSTFNLDTKGFILPEVIKSLIYFIKFQNYFIFMYINMIMKYPTISKNQLLDERSNFDSVI